MSAPPQKVTHPVDTLAPKVALSAMLASHAAAVAVAGDALEPIAKGARLMANGVARGARLHFAAAGSSGLMALADACELHGTFGIASSQIAIHMAGGVPVDGIIPGETDDNTEDAIRDASSLAPEDVAIVVSASGTTPYAIAFAQTARARGGRVIGIANVAGSALLDLADVAVALPTQPEILAGSTRLGAGTVQKVALNMMSTQMGILLGHVHDGLMVNFRPENTKLRKRAVDIVRQISAASQSEAERALQATDCRTKAAVLVARGIPKETALALLDRHKGRLRACLADPDAIVAKKG